MTYDLILSLLSSSGDYATDTSGGFGPNCYFIGKNSSGGANLGSSGANLNYAASTISLDGASPISLFSLPSGFNLLGNSVSLKESAGGIPGQLMLRSVLSPLGEYSGITGRYSTFSGTQLYPGTGAFDGPQTQSYSWISAQPTAVQDLYLSLQFQLLVYGSSWTTVLFQNLIMHGAYQIISTQWVLENLTHPSLSPDRALSGDRMRLTSSAPGNLTTVTEITINNTPVVPPYEEQTDTVIIFTIPTLPSQGPVPITITNPTQFSGTAMIGPLTILEANSSGIYTLTSGKTCDTIYISTSNNETEDIKIPNPTIKTGFIGG